jgi:hypothetical protein
VQVHVFAGAQTSAERARAGSALSFITLCQLTAGELRDTGKWSHRPPVEG